MSKNDWVKFVGLFLLVLVISLWTERHGYVIGQDCQQPASVPACSGNDATICSGCAPNQFCCPKTAPGGCNESFENLCQFTKCMSDPASICLIASPTPSPTPSPGPTPTPAPQAGHTITVMNNCSQTIWVGIQPQVQAVTIQGTPQPTPPTGFELDSGDNAVAIAPFTWTSAIIWARTGCTFNRCGECPNPGPTPPANCCDTGGCTDGSENFVINCINGPDPPVTVAEFTLTTQGGTDFYDVSMVSGSNVSIEIVPDSSTYDLTEGEDPGISSCTSDSDCIDASFPKCDTALNNGNGFCVNPFYCASPGCTESSGCAADGFDKSFLSSSTWGATPCATSSDCGSNATCVSGKCETDFAINEVQCTPVPIGTGMNTDTIDLQFNSQQNQGTDYVGCITPQKFCRTACTSDKNCPAPQTCDTTSGFCTLNGEILGTPCDLTSIPCMTDSDCVDSSGGVPGTCDTTTNTCTGGTATSFDQLWGCTGTNAASCFTANVDANCCGCPPWAPSALCANNNPEWQTVAEPIFKIFQDAAPPVYTFPFDDAIATYTCSSGSTDNVTAYTVTFCPQVDTDDDSITNAKDQDADNDGIPNTEESASTEINSQISSVSLQREIPEDPDGDRLPNELDLDSDGDCICDILEAGGIDEDRDCVVDNFADSDEDGLNDSQDPDQGGVAFPLTDTDNDGTPDFLDPDSDNDGVTDTNETIGGMDVDGDGIQDDSEDLNGDGIADSCHPATGIPIQFLDSDGDGIFDHLDSNDNTSQAGGGCTIGLAGVSTSIPLYLLIPVFIMVCRLWRRYKS